ncbi:hypothetical protein ACJX0J_022172, partial [Zea mays]
RRGGFGGPRFDGNAGPIIPIVQSMDLVIFPALDIRVKNVAGTYSLEHKGENDLFAHQTRLLLFQKKVIFRRIVNKMTRCLGLEEGLSDPKSHDQPLDSCSAIITTTKRNSRGPLIDSYDHVIGVNTTTLTCK